MAMIGHIGERDEVLVFIARDENGLGYLGAKYVQAVDAPKPESASMTWKERIVWLASGVYIATVFTSAFLGAHRLFHLIVRFIHWM